MSPVTFEEKEIQIKQNKQYLLNRWWTPEELAEEKKKIESKTSRYSAQGREKILKASGVTA